MPMSIGLYVWFERKVQTNYHHYLPNVRFVAAQFITPLMFSSMFVVAQLIAPLTFLA